MARPNVLASLSLALLAATPASALDWPQFRGAHRDGVSAETGLARAWSPEGPRVVWRRPIGEGYSSISAVGDRLYTMDSDGTTEYVLALDAASGKELWRVPAGPKLNDSMGNGPRTTPTVDEIGNTRIPSTGNWGNFVTGARAAFLSMDDALVALGSTPDPEPDPEPDPGTDPRDQQIADLVAYLQALR